MRRSASGAVPIEEYPAMLNLDLAQLEINTVPGHSVTIPGR